MADLWLAPRVGTDAALALAMIHVLITRGASTTRRSSPAGAMASTSWPRAPRNTRRRRAGAHRRARGATSSPPPACMPTGPPPSSAATASTPSAPACRRSAPTTASSPSAGNVDRPGGNLRMRTPKGFRNYIELLHMPAFRLDRRDRAAHHRRRPLPAVGRAQGLADGLPQPLRHRRHAHRPPLSRARALRQRGQHPRHLSQHAPHHRGAALARLRRGGGARHDADGGIRRHRAAEDHHAGGGRGLLHALRARPSSSPAPSCRRRARRAREIDIAASPAREDGRSARR